MNPEIQSKISELNPFELTGRELEDFIDQHNLHDKQALPDGKYISRFLAMLQPYPEWRDKNTTRNYFLIQHKNKTIVAGFFGNLDPRKSSLQMHLHRVLTGQQASGYLSLEMYEPYRGKRLLVDTRWQTAGKLQKLYPRTIGVYDAPPLKSWQQEAFV